MKRSRLAVLFLALSMALWAVCPAALAEEINWLTPGETAPEPVTEERSVEDDTAWATPTEDSAEGEEMPEPTDSRWLDPSETAEEEAPAPEEDDKWLDPGETPVEEESEPEEDTKWLNPGETLVEEEPEPEDEPQWLTPDQAQEAPAEPEPEPEDAPEWLTPDAAADAEEEPAPNQSEQPEEPEGPKAEDPKPEELEPVESEQQKTPDPEVEKGALIEVTVPASGEMVINPHRMPVKLDGKIIRDQLINTPQTMINRSDVPIIVTASLTVNGGETNGVTVTDHPIAEGETEKLAYLYVEFQNLAEGETEPAWSESYTGAGNQLLAMSGETVSGDVLRVEAGDEIPTLASYRIFGSLTENPEISWRNGDKLSVTVSFTFRPAEDAEVKPEATEEPDETEPKPEEVEPTETEPKPEEVVTEPVEAEPKQEETVTEPEEAEPTETEPKPEEVEPTETDPEPEEAEPEGPKADAKPEEQPEDPPPEPDPGPEPSDSSDQQ